MKKFLKSIATFAPIIIPVILLSLWLGWGYLEVFKWTEIYREMTTNDRLNLLTAVGSVFLIALMIGGIIRFMINMNKDHLKKEKMTDEKMKLIRRSVPSLMLPTYLKLIKKFPEDYAKWVISNSSYRSKYRDIKKFANDHFASWSETPPYPQDKYTHVACHIVSMHLMGGTILSASANRIGSKGEYEYILPQSIPLADELWIRIVSHLAPVVYMQSEQKSLIEHDVLAASDLALRLTALGRNPSGMSIGNDVSTILEIARIESKSILRGRTGSIDSIANSIQEKRSMNSHQIKIALQKSEL